MILDRALPFTLSLMLFVFSASAQWTFWTVDSAGNVGDHTGLKMDSIGYPNISYLDRSNGDLKCTWQNGSSWYNHTVDGLDDVGYDTSINCRKEGGKR